MASAINISSVSGVNSISATAASVSIGSANSNSSTLSLSMLTGTGASTTSSTVLSTLHNDTTHDFNGAFSMEESCSLGAAGGDTSDSKDSQLQTQQQQQSAKDELPKEWFYDEMDMNDVDSLEDPKSPADDEYDYDPRYGNKKRRKRRPGKRAATNASGESASASNSSSARRRSAATRTRISTTDALLDASLEAIEAGDIGGTPTSSGGRRSRGAGTRGRRRAKGVMSTSSTASTTGGMPSNSCDPTSPGLVIEPPSFESAAAAVSVGAGVGVEDGNAHLRNYRKYL